MAASDAVTGATPFAPTHRVPAGGLPAWDAPDPTRPPSATAGEDLEVRVLEERADGWTWVAFANGWRAWVDGRRLTPVRTPTGFRATHRVPAGGMAAWEAPDSTAPSSARIDGGMDVEQLERRPDGWARVACWNGWAAWVDGRLLVAPATTNPAAATTAPPKAPTAVRPSPFVLGGAALVVLSSFLPWFSVPGESMPWVAAAEPISAWGLPVRFLIFRTPGDTHPRTGLLLVTAVFVALPYLTGRPVPRWAVLLFAAVGIDLALFAVSRVLRPAPHPDLGVGVLVALVGGGMLAWDFWRTRLAEKAGSGTP